MHLTTQEISVQNLAVGMYVSRLDVPWVQTPFPIQGFYISKQEELDLLSHYCNKVYIDTFLSKVDVRAQLTTTTVKKNEKEIDPQIARLMKEKARFKPRVEDYAISSGIYKEVRSASTIYQDITAKMSSIYRDMELNGYIDVREVHSASHSMVKSVIKNPNALAWLCRISTEHGVLHQQAIRSAVWAMIFARHLGLSRIDMQNIGTALLLAPIGKCKLPSEILTSHETEEELAQFQQHVELTLEETEKMFSVKHQINNILSSYCERNNGTGFPRKLVGNRIPFLARIAGIADYYENLINPYFAEEALTPVEAISHLYNVRGNLLQTELVESFIQAIGIYPTGSLVQLANNKVAVVVEQPEKSRLRPRVAIIKDEQDQLLKKPVIVNLAKKKVDKKGNPLHIEKSLKSTSQDISANELHQQLFSGKRWFSFVQF